MRFLPSSASSTLLISLLICAAVDIRLLWRFHSRKIVLVTWLPCVIRGISPIALLTQNTRISKQFSMTNRLFREWHFRTIPSFTLGYRSRFVSGDRFSDAVDGPNHAPL